jgi:putative ABC transport system permease protein
VRLAIATVIMVLSAGAGFRSLIDAQVGALGSNTLFIQTRVPPTTKSRASASPASNDGTGSFNGVVITTLKQRDLDVINKLPNVVGSYGMVTGQAVASYRNTEKSVIYYGASAQRFTIDQHTLKSGRFYTPSEDAGGAQVAILGNNLAESLFNQDTPIGKLIRLGNLNFEVVGVYNPQGSFGGAADDSLYIPLVTAQKKMLGIDHMSIAVVQMHDITTGDATAEAIRAELRRSHDITNPDKEDFIVQTQAQALESFNTIFNGITALLIAIAAISLVVGGVGIMNIMYVVVTERTSEIGLKKALGATQSTILTEFLIESVLVTVLGGIIGIAFGAFLGYIVSLAASAGGLAWNFIVPPYAIAIGFGV